MNGHKITVVLTSAQYNALNHAVALAKVTLEQDGEGASDRGTLRALQNGWKRFTDAWNRTPPAVSHD